MNEHAKRIRKPRCFLLYAIAPREMPAAEANRILNAFIADPRLPLAIFHDHFIGEPGGIVIFYVESREERDALLSQTYLDGWRVEIQPLIFSHSPSAFDEQIAFTLFRKLDRRLGHPDRRARAGAGADSMAGASLREGNGIGAARRAGAGSGRHCPRRGDRAARPSGAPRAAPPAWRRAGRWSAS